MNSQEKNLYVSSLEEPEEKWGLSDIDWVDFGKGSPSVRTQSRIHFAFASEKSFDTKFLEQVKKLGEKMTLLLLHYQANNFDDYLHKLVDNVSKEIIRKTIAFDDFKVLKRITNAWKSDSQELLISNAIFTEHKLVVSDCASNRYEVGFDLIPEIASIVDKKKFDLDDDGSFLYWAEADFHLNLEDIRCRIDSKFAASILRKQVPKNKLYGKAIRIFREQRNLKQIDVEGISERTVRRIEGGQFVPTLETLRQLSKAHKLELNEYIDQVANVYQSLKEKRPKVKGRRFAV